MLVQVALVPKVANVAWESRCRTRHRERWRNSYIMHWHRMNRRKRGSSFGAGAWAWVDRTMFFFPAVWNFLGNARGELTHDKCWAGC